MKQIFMKKKIIIPKYFDITFYGLILSIKYTNFTIDFFKNISVIW